MHSPALNNDKDPYELSVTSEPSVWGGHQNITLDHRGEGGGGQDRPKKDHIIFERSLIRISQGWSKILASHCTAQIRQNLWENVKDSKIFLVAKVEWAIHQLIIYKIFQIQNLRHFLYFIFWWLFILFLKSIANNTPFMWTSFAWHQTLPGKFYISISPCWGGGLGMGWYGTKAWTLGLFACPRERWVSPSIPWSRAALNPEYQDPEALWHTKQCTSLLAGWRAIPACM